MGDRALIQITDDTETSPVLYLHWSGAYVAMLLEDWEKQMNSRITDVSYGFARLVARACNRSGGDSQNLSVGVQPQESILTAQDSHGDAGVFVVNVKTKTVRWGGGYGPAHQEEVGKSFKTEPFKWVHMNEDK